METRNVIHKLEGDTNMSLGHKLCAAKPSLLSDCFDDGQLLTSRA